MQLYRILSIMSLNQAIFLHIKDMSRDCFLLVINTEAEFLN